MRLPFRIEALAVLGLLWITGCAQPPVQSLEAARRAISAAHSVKSGGYSAPELKRAQEALKSALAEANRQDSRLLFFLRNYDAAISSAEAARRQANSARIAAATRRLTLRGDAQHQISDIEAACDSLRLLIDNLPLESSARVRLTMAQIAINESQIAFRQEDYARAARRTAEARARIREVEAQTRASIQQFAEKARAKWKHWVDETILWSAKTGGYALVVDKMSRTCELYQNGASRRTYPVELGPNYMTDKLMAGDRATPEGKYRVTAVKGPGETKYHRAFGLNYPNQEDWEKFRRLKREGRIPRRAGIGSLIEIHGTGGRGSDWTSGCIALTDRDIDELSRFVHSGTPVTIVGYRGGDLADVLLRAGRKASRRNGKG